MTDLRQGVTETQHAVLDLIDVADEIGRMLSPESQETA